MTFKSCYNFFKKQLKAAHFSHRGSNFFLLEIWIKTGQSAYLFIEIMIPHSDVHMRLESNIQICGSTKYLKIFGLDNYEKLAQELLSYHHFMSW